MDGKFQNSPAVVKLFCWRVQYSRSYDCLISISRSFLICWMMKYFFLIVTRRLDDSAGVVLWSAFLFGWCSFFFIDLGFKDSCWFDDMKDLDDCWYLWVIVAFDDVSCFFPRRNRIVLQLFGMLSRFFSKNQNYVEVLFQDLRNACLQKRRLHVLLTSAIR